VKRSKQIVGRQQTFNSRAQLWIPVTGTIEEVLAALLRALLDRFEEYCSGLIGSSAHSECSADRTALIGCPEYGRVGTAHH
jgi:hypothetical protein